MTLAVLVGGVAVFFVAITGGTRLLARGRPDSGHRRVARSVDRLRRRAADVRRARLPRTVRAPVRRITRSSPASPTPRRTSRSPGCWSSSVALVAGALIALVNAVAAPQRALARRRGRPGGGLLRGRRRHRLVRQQLHRQAERAGARDAVHRAQHRDDAPGLRARPDRAAAVSRRKRASRRSTPRTTRRRSRTSGCGTGARCRTRCGRFRRSAPTTTSPTSTSIATTSTARSGR